MSHSGKENLAEAWELRPGREDDTPALLMMNEAEVPAVSPMTAESFAALKAEAESLTVVARGDEVGGFLLAFAPGAAYASANYQWFCARYQRFSYVDRIVVAPAARGYGIGQRLYELLERHARELGRDMLCCEVNVRPMNAGSLRFHKRHGFHEVGQQDTDGGTKRVSMLALPLVSLPQG